MPNKPNIIFILLDDMGWRDLGCAGSTFYETPNIDRLARGGMIFPNAYAACPVCSPSRASYLTGKYPARVGVTDWIDMTGDFHPLKARLIDAPYRKDIPLGMKTLPESLHEEGYATWHVGKWHLGDEEHYPEKYGYEKNIGGCSWGHPHQGYFSPYGIHTLPEGPEGEYLTDRITDEAIRLIESGEERPFFLSLCHYTVHTPIQAKQKDIDRFLEKAKAIEEKEQVLVTGEPIPSHLDQRVIRRMVQSNATYAAMIWNLDENIGRLMDALERSGKADNTIVVFTSDNGGLATAEGSPTCNLPAREGKGWMYEGGTRVPLFVWYPRLVKPNTCCRTAVTTSDFYPTFMDLIGAAERTPEDVEGVSLLPLLQGEPIEERAMYWHYPHYGNQGGTPGASVVLGRWKLIEFFEDHRCELYDLETDLSEQNDVAARHPEKVEKLRSMLHAWQDSAGALFPAVNEDWDESLVPQA